MHSAVRYQVNRGPPAVVEGSDSCNLAPPATGVAPVGVEAEGAGPLLAAAVAGGPAAAAGCCTAAADGLGRGKEKVASLPGANEAAVPVAVEGCAGASPVSPVKLGTLGGPAEHKLSTGYRIGQGILTIRPAARTRYTEGNASWRNIINAWPCMCTPASARPDTNCKTRLHLVLMID